MNPKNPKRSLEVSPKTKSGGSSPPGKTPRASSIPDLSKINKELTELQLIRNNLRPVNNPNMVGFSNMNTSTLSESSDESDHTQGASVSIDPITQIVYFPKNLEENFLNTCKLKIKKEIRQVFPLTKPNILQNGNSISIEVPQSTASSANKITSLVNVEVTHKVYNSRSHSGRQFCWGKIFAPDLMNSEEEDIQEGLSEENPEIEILRVIRANKGADHIPTSMLKIKFKQDEPPSEVYILDMPYKCEIYFPPPKKCHKCLRFGHWSRDCRGTSRCQNCSGQHSHESCRRLYCDNCFKNGFSDFAHASFDSSCPTYLKEKDIIRISFEKNIPFPQARIEYNAGYRPNSSKKKHMLKPPPDLQDQTPMCTLKDAKSTQ